jgi:hypothetical protein
MVRSFLLHAAETIAQALAAAAARNRHAMSANVPRRRGAGDAGRFPRDLSRPYSSRRHLELEEIPVKVKPSSSTLCFLGKVRRCPIRLGIGKASAVSKMLRNAGIPGTTILVHWPAHGSRVINLSSRSKAVCCLVVWPGAEARALLVTEISQHHAAGLASRHRRKAWAFRR